MTCPKCGTETGSAKFCPECGEKIVANEEMQKEPIQETAQVNPKPNNIKFIIPIVALALVVVILIGILLGNGQNKPSSENDIPEDVEVGDVVDNRLSEVNADYSEKDFTTKTYLYEDKYATTYFVVIKNNSKATVAIKINGVAKDSSGNTVGAADASVNVLGPGEETMQYLYFKNVKNVAKVDCTYSYDSSNYSAILKDLSVQQSVNSGNVVVSIKNNGKAAASFVEAHALFFDSNGNVVHHDYKYVNDSDYQIKPGATLSAQLNSRNDFASVKVYLDARADK